MIQQIVITDYLLDAANQPLSLVDSLLSACPSLYRAHWQVQTQAPLQACLQRLMAKASHSTLETAVATVLAQPQATKHRASFCLIPVALHVQRDSFSLQGTVPLAASQYAAITTLIQAHFADVFTLHTDDTQRYWWVTPHQAIDAQSGWPQAYLFQPAFAWQPKGPHGSVLRQWSNEIQMLLHQAQQMQDSHTIPDTLNALWFASVGEQPSWQPPFTQISGTGAVFQGLSQAGLTTKALPNVTALYETPAPNAHTLYIVDDVTAVDWARVENAIQQKQVSELTITLPFAERHLQVQVTPPRWWQRWSTPPSRDAVHQALQSHLQH